MGVGNVGGYEVASAAKPTPIPATVWKLADGTTGSSSNAQITAAIGDALADVNTVAWDDDFVYIRTSGVPSHSIGPFNPRNPNTPADQDATYRISLEPTEANDHEMTRLSNIGVMVNGVGLFNWSDATTWNRQTNRLEMVTMGRFGDWNTNALWNRMSGLDSGGGHPAGGGLYHYHPNPAELVEQLDPGNDGNRHSSLLGFAFDGFPIYGQYAYANRVDDSAGFEQMTSSYQLIESRPANGPSEASFELGSFAEDFVYVEGTGTLNEFNMAFVNTPDYPDGTWAYFTTFDKDGSGTDLDGDVAFPFTVGPRFFGEVDALMLSRNPVVNVPDDATFEFAWSSIGTLGDCNGDGVVDQDDLLCACQNDLSEVLEQTGLIRGDLDGDGEVAFADFLTLSGSFGQEGVGYAAGDVDCDGLVGFEDFLLLSSKFGESSSAATSVPEPGGMLMIYVAGLAALLLRPSTRASTARR